MKKIKNIEVEGDVTLNCGISSGFIDTDTDNPKRLSDNIFLLMEDYNGEEDIETTVFLSKDNAIELAITLLRYAQKMNTVLPDVKCVTQAIKGEDLYTPKEIPIQEILKLYQI